LKLNSNQQIPLNPVIKSLYSFFIHITSGGAVQWNINHGPSFNDTELLFVNLRVTGTSALSISNSFSFVDVTEIMSEILLLLSFLNK
jgi:hypothetical protein